MNGFIISSVTMMIAVLTIGITALIGAFIVNFEIEDIPFMSWMVACCSTAILIVALLIQKGLLTI